jgi:hypothetical protein
VLTEVLIVATNLLLQVTPFMMALSTVTVFFTVPGIVAMGIGLGAASRTSGGKSGPDGHQPGGSSSRSPARVTSEW